LSRPFDVNRFGLIYAGAQKNLGPAGVSLVIIRQDMLDRVKIGLPNMLNYQNFVAKNSTYNTPPMFAIYAVGLVVQWLDDTVGGLEAMAAYNRTKASLLYDMLDDDGVFYKATAERDSRSNMNVTFRLPTVDLEKEFVAEAKKEGLGGLKGHRSVGGIRASIYNAVPLEAVQELAGFMKEFRRIKG
jgi:phosphoserine aminotransferase